MCLQNMKIEMKCKNNLDFYGGQVSVERRYK